MKFGVHKGTWGKYYNPQDAVTFLEQAARTGAETAEFNASDAMLAHDAAEIRRVREACDRLSIEPLLTVAMPAGLDMRSPDKYIREAATQHVIRTCQSAAEIGARSINGAGSYSTWPSRYDFDMITPEDKIERTKRSAECVHNVAVKAQEYGVRINVEILNRFENYIINTVDEGLAFVRQIDCPNVGLLVDAFHLSHEEDDLPDAFARAGKMIGHVHVTEPNRKVPYHTARIPWPEIGRVLRECDYEGSVTIEAVLAFEGAGSYNMRMWRDQIEDTSLDGRLDALYHGLNYLREQFLQ
ncbi:MAG: sugar phosphate isomerase/epimerase [Lachnospiraceae bacterium]|nr:sugar phosphate isomerase/epimerase [Lachnospiraceae bacterium]